MQTCKDCGHDYNEFTSGTPASEHKCDDCSGNPDKRVYPAKLARLDRHKLARVINNCPNCGSKDLEGWTAGGQAGFTCATCGHDQTTKIDDTTYHRKHPDKRSS
tara:strand:- start:317 stop:628 length:312 start_codon:yes stop_codon:yes gene_type:complete